MAINFDEATLLRLRKTPLEKPIALPERVENANIPEPYRSDFFQWLIGHKQDLGLINIKPEGNVEASYFHAWLAERALEAGCPEIMKVKAEVSDRQGFKATYL